MRDFSRCVPAPGAAPVMLAATASPRLASALTLTLTWTLLLTAVFTPAPGRAADSAAPGSVQIGNASITYIARAGDTLMSIARQYTDKPGNWVALGKLNRIDQDSSIPIGTALLIPGELLTDTPANATVVAMTGNVSALTAAGVATRLALGSSVAEGTRIDTGNNSFLTLGLVDQSRISIPSNSQVQLVKLRTARYLNSPRTQVLLLRGRVESRVTPMAPMRGRYEVRTPMSVAGVRGTHFRVGYVADAKRHIATETLEGRVAVATASQATAPDGIVLGGGQGNLTDARTVGMPIDLLPAPRLVAPVGGGRPEFPADRIVLLRVAGARAYHLQVATDAEAVNLIAESRSDAAAIRLDGIADGDYYVRLSAIDRFGLEGFDSIEPISLRGHSPATATAGAVPAAPAVAASDDKTVTLRWTSAAGRSMRLQVARDAGFTYLLGTRISKSGEARLPRPAFGTYYARVEALDDQGNASGTSAVQGFIVTDQWIMNDGTPTATRQNRSNSAQ